MLLKRKVVNKWQAVTGGRLTGLPRGGRGTSALGVAVIPAKAGIHPANLWRCAVHRLDSRFRGNDWYFEVDPTPNDTTTGEQKAADRKR